jgi:Cytochrome c554 and c-prime
VSLRFWIFAFGFVLTVFCAETGAATRDWVGSARCGQCHPQQFSAWQATAHARRFRVGTGEGRRCLSCHTTGESPAGAVVEDAVGCEACHGAGTDYATDDIMRNRLLALDLGLLDLGLLDLGPGFGAASGRRAALCATCHTDVTMRTSPDATRLSRPAHPPLAPLETSR